MRMEVTSVSTKGQVVIPGSIRRLLKLSPGAKLMIMTDGENLLMKPIRQPKINTFKNLIKESRDLAKRTGLTKSDISEAIKQVRRESCSGH